MATVNEERPMPWREEVEERLNSPLTPRGDGHPWSVAVSGSDTPVHRKHPPDDDFLLVHIFVSAQVELGLQLARGFGRNRPVKVEKGTQSEQKAAQFHAAFWRGEELEELSRCGRQQSVTGVSSAPRGDVLQHGNVRKDSRGGHWLQWVAESILSFISCET